MTPRTVTIAGIAALLFMSGPLAAEEISVMGRNEVTWGATSLAVVRLVPQEELRADEPAEVLFFNRMTLGNPLVLQFRLEIDGLSVDVTVVNGEGDLPDIITVLPPPGFMADPPSLAVLENDTGRIAIRQVPMS